MTDECGCCETCRASLPDHWISDLWRYCAHNQTMSKRRSRSEPWTLERNVSPEQALAHVTAAVGPRLLGILSALTDSIVELVDKNVPSIDQTAERLRLGAQAAYGPGKFIKWASENEPDVPPPVPWYRLTPLQLRRSRGP